ncbi:MAG: hypothetical protein IPL65_06265 [Lewinellaceae bacterium]|nr:hypothetical protein [Lewinellaceae bacterium]
MSGSSPIWGGKAYTTPGIFCDTIRTLAGCDSIACMHISVLDPAPVTMIGTALCPGTAYEWNGRAYQTPGIYIKTFPSKSGCDSIVQLRIEVLDSIPVTYIDSIVAPERVSAEMLTDTLPGYFGCDSVVVIRFRRP